jgi:hypothetical protein
MVSRLNKSISEFASQALDTLPASVHLFFATT